MKTQGNLDHQWCALAIFSNFAQIWSHPQRVQLFSQGQVFLSQSMNVSLSLSKYN